MKKYPCMYLPGCAGQDQLAERPIFEERMKILFTALVLSFALLGGTANADDATLVREANNALAKKDYKTAFAKFTTLAEQGKPAAQFNLGAFYLNGQGVKKDEKQAFEWFRKSAAQGNSRALQVMEKAAAKGNVYAINELKIIKGQAASAKVIPAAQETPQVKLQEKPQEKPQALPQEKPQAKIQEKPKEKPQETPKKQAASRSVQGTLLYGDPTVAAPGKWVYGISADLSMYKATEPLYYPDGGVLSNTTQSYSVAQPGVSAWIGQGDISVLTSFARRSGDVDATVQGVGALSKSFTANVFELDVRWLIRQFSAANFMPYVVGGIALNSTSGTANEVDFSDDYSQKDTMLMLGAGAIIPLDKQYGFRVEGRAGTDKQKASGDYTSISGAPLSFTSYSYSATASFTRLSAAMYYKMSGGWNAEVSVRRGDYAAGIGPSFSDTTVRAAVGYSFR
jgi:hypothetical protein